MRALCWMLFMFGLIAVFVTYSGWKMPSSVVRAQGGLRDVSREFDQTNGGSPSPEDILHREWQKLPVEALDSFVFNLEPEVRGHLPPLDFRALIFEGEGIDWSGIGGALLGLLWSEIVDNVDILIQLIVLGLFASFLHVIASGWGQNGATDVAFLVSLLVLLLLGLKAFERCVDVAAASLNQMLDLLHALLPIMSMMLAAVGAVTTAAIFHPLIYATVTGVATVVKTALFPLVLISVTLAVIGSISPHFPLKRMEGLLRTGSLSLLTLLFVVFVAVVQARSVVAPVADGFAIRTVKFLTSTFIPVVGGRIADAMDLIVGGSVLIKNAIGLFGMGAVIVVTAFPVIKILSLLIIFKLAAALIEPITDERIVHAMTGMANGIGLIAAGLITAALMFFVGITVVVSVGNTAAVMR